MFLDEHFYSQCFHVVSSKHKSRASVWLLSLCLFSCVWELTKMVLCYIIGWRIQTEASFFTQALISHQEGGKERKVCPQNSNDAEWLCWLWFRGCWFGFKLCLALWPGALCCLKGCRVINTKLIMLFAQLAGDWNLLMKAHDHIKY